MILKLKDDILEIRIKIEAIQEKLLNYDNFKTYDEKIDTEKLLDKLKFEESLLLREFKSSYEEFKTELEKKINKSEEIRNKLHEEINQKHNNYKIEVEKMLDKANNELLKLYAGCNNYQVYNEILKTNINISEMHFKILKMHLTPQIRKSIGIYY